MRILVSISIATFALAGCSSSDGSGNGPATSTTDEFVMKSEQFTVAPGSEKYLCYTTHVAEDTAFHSFSIGKYPLVHHMFFAKTFGTPEDDAPHECPVLFKPTWLPLFTTGKGDTTLTLPEGSGFKLVKGDQLLMQLHLLNTTSEPITETVEVHAEKLAAADVTYSAALYPFGTTVFAIPPNRQSSVTHDCTVDQDMEAFVMFPHMHRLGKEMAFQLGKDEASLAEVWRGSYDFDAQRLIPQTFSLHNGDHARVTCTYDNTTNRTVGYGEHTDEEMCFFSLFVKDGKQLDGTCVDITNVFKAQDGGVISPPPSDAGGQ